MHHYRHFATKLDRWHIVLGVVLALMESIGDPAATIIIGKMWGNIEKLIKGQRTSEAFLHNGQIYGYCLLGITVYTALLNWLGYFVWSSFGYRLGHRARSMLFKILVQRQTSWLDSKGNLEGESAMHFKDIQDIEIASGIASYEMLAMGAGCIIEVGVALYFSWAVTLVCLAGVPVLIFIGGIFSTPIVNAILASKSILDSMSSRVSWVLNSLVTVKVLQKEDFEHSNVRRTLQALLGKNLHYCLLSSSQQALSRVVVLMIFMQGFYFGSFMVRDHGLSAGNVITVFWCCLNASALLQAFMNHLIEWNKAKASAQRLARIFDIDEDKELLDSIGIVPDLTTRMQETLQGLGWRVNTPNDLDPFYSPEDTKHDVYRTHSSSLQSFSSIDLASFSSDTRRKPFVAHSPNTYSSFGKIEFEEVVFSYPTRHEVILAGISMEFATGENTFVVGPSGSGKSTLASLLSKEYPWQAGSVTIDGNDVQLLSKRWIEDNVYVCEQSPSLFDISIKQNVALGARDPSKVTDEDIKKAIDDSCATFVWDMRDNIDSREVGKLSGGQKQRILLARARLRDAPIMIYDEVTSALDNDLQTAVMSQILSYRQGKTTIIITHDLSIIPRGHVVYSVNDGQATRFSDISEVHDFETLTRSQEIDLGSDMNPKIGDTLATPLNSDEKKFSIENLELEITGSARKELHEGSASITLLKSVPDKKFLLLGFSINCLHAAVNPVFSFVFSKLIAAIVNPNEKHTTMWAMLVLMLAFVDGSLTLAKFTLNITSERWLLYVRQKLYGLLLNSSNYNLGSEQASYYTKLLMSDTEKCADILSKYLPGVLSILVIGLVGFICSFAFGWKLTLVGLSLLPAFVGINQVYKTLVTRWTRVRESKRSRVVRLIMELTSEKGFRTLKVQHLEDYFKAIYLKTEGELHSIATPMSLQIGLGYGVLKCFPYALEALVLWYGMHLIGVGDYSVQQTMTVFSLLMFTIVTIDQLTSTIGNIGSGFEALERLQTALRGGDDATRPAPDIYRSSLPLSDRIRAETKPLWKTVSFQRVEKKFTNGTTILSGFTETFQEGETVAIVGPSGIGKSSIARMLERLDVPTTGEVVIDGTWDLETLSLFDIRSNVGLVGQAPLDFFDGTIEETLLYGLDRAEGGDTSAMIEICKLCGAHNFITKLENVYDTRIKSGHLSGGQMQLLGIARVLIRQPRVLILDECTSALDLESKGTIMQMIKRLRDKRSMIILVITHQMDVAGVADRIVSLDKTARS